MKYLFLFYAILFSVLSSAQDCSEEVLLKIPKIWKENTPGKIEGITATNLAKEKKAVALIQNMIKSKYTTPKGADIHFHSTYGKPFTNMTGDFYRYSILPTFYYCKGNQLENTRGTSNEFLMSANIMEPEIYDTLQDGGLTDVGFNYMLDIPVEKNGVWEFKESEKPIARIKTGKSTMWLVTYDGKLPYAFVSRKEFLEKRIRALTYQLHMAAAGEQDVLKNIEIEKGFKEKEFKNDPEKLKRYLKLDYSPVKGRYEKLLAENENHFKPAFEKVQAQLKMPATELNQPAIVKMDPYDGLSYLFTDDDDLMGKVLIKPNPGYFNKKLSKSSPQFFWVYILWDHAESNAIQFRTDIIKAVDFAALKNMLGK